MDCPACRASNTSGLKYCVRCGRNLESSQEVNYENIGMNGYHTQKEYSQNKNEFENMFAINDKNTAYISSEMFTSEERSQFGETDFGGRDEPLASQPYKDSLSGRADDMKSNYINQSVEKELDFGGRDEPLVSQPYTDRLNVPTQQSSINSVPLPSQPYMSANPYMNPPAFNEALPQIIGYDPNGMPIYSQPPVTYSPPQIIGYDPNGMPIYAQSPVTYAPPQIIGYDPSGMPIYAQQPVLYQQSSVP
ncbi:MAG: hypothetical protein K2K14_00425, partial [Ruminococcus sp.]|nr:hypothetical protein [Ruminococcus sp.]